MSKINSEKKEGNEDVYGKMTNKIKECRNYDQKEKKVEEYMETKR